MRAARLNTSAAGVGASASLATSFRCRPSALTSSGASAPSGGRCTFSHHSSPPSAKSNFHGAEAASKSRSDSAQPMPEILKEPLKDTRTVSRLMPRCTMPASFPRKASPSDSCSMPNLISCSPSLPILYFSGTASGRSVKADSTLCTDPRIGSVTSTSWLRVSSSGSMICRKHGCFTLDRLAMSLLTSSTYSSSPRVFPFSLCSPTMLRLSRIHTLTRFVCPGITGARREVAGKIFHPRPGPALATCTLSIS
mmetsp:Transcript_39525/g.101042  ORF Transcript_39525/g.101042 Transcript_39525/m.101042 type:complete len:252 (+) Transcript_39525:1351-2106(+)